MLFYKEFDCLNLSHFLYLPKENRTEKKGHPAHIFCPLSAKSFISAIRPSPRMSWERRGGRFMPKGFASSDFV